MGLLEKIKLGAIATLVIVCSWLFVDLHLTKSALREASQAAKSFERVVQSQNRITESEERTATVLEEVTQAVKDTPNAQVLVPPDVAAAWADGIDRLRNDTSAADDSTKHLPRSVPNKA